MRILHYDVAVHWGGSFACVYNKRILSFTYGKDTGDLIVTIGRMLIIVSDINKIDECNRGVP